MKKRLLSAALLSVLCLAGCAGAKTAAGPQEPQEPVGPVVDPALVEARDTKKASVPSIPNTFRKAEKASLTAARNQVLAEIDALETVEAVENYSFESFASSIGTTKTNAKYTMDEMMTAELTRPAKYSNCSTIGLAWPVTDDGFIRSVANTYGYVADTAEYTLDGLEFEFSCKSDGNISIAGIMLFNDNPSYDGVDGYLVNIVSDGTNEFVQTYILQNCYGTSTVGFVCDYLGGWVFDRGPIDGQTIHVSIKSDMMMFSFPEDTTDYQGEFVDLTLPKGQTFDVPEKVHFSALAWGNPANVDIKLSQIFSNDEVDGLAKIKASVDAYKETIKFDNYSDENIELINQGYAALKALDNYDAVAAGLAQFAAFVKSLPNKNAGSSTAAAIALADSIMSPSSPGFYLPGWTHEEGTGVITTHYDAAAIAGGALYESGWRLSGQTYTNFELTYIQDTASAVFNPFDGLHETGIVFGTTPNATGMSASGFSIDLYVGAAMSFIEVVKFSDLSTCVCTFIDAIAGDFTNKVIKITMNNGKLGINIDGEDDAWEFGGGAQLDLGAQGYTGGYVGVYDWATSSGRKTTFLDFKTL